VARTRKATRMPAGLTGTMHGTSDLAERAAGAVAALTRMAEQRTSGHPRAVGQLAVELIAEHVRHGRAVAILIDRDPERDGTRQIQEDFVRTSLERMNQFALCCVQLLEAASVAEERKAEPEDQLRPSPRPGSAGRPRCGSPRRLAARSLPARSGWCLYAPAA
jgi:K+-sensing histidine kinase KdpD